MDNPNPIPEPEIAADTGLPKVSQAEAQRWLRRAKFVEIYEKQRKGASQIVVNICIYAMDDQLYLVRIMNNWICARRDANDRKVKGDYRPVPVKAETRVVYLMQEDGKPMQPLPKE